jgi:hypothetical protein
MCIQGVVTLDSPQNSCEQRGHVLICRPPVLAGTLEAKLQQGRAVFTDLVIYRAQAKTLLQFQSEGMISVCGDGLRPSFTVSPDVPRQIILTQVYAYVCVCVCVCVRACVRACVPRALLGPWSQCECAHTRAHTHTRLCASDDTFVCIWFFAVFHRMGLSWS